MKRDPIEETEEFMAIEEEVDRKVMLYFIDFRIKALKDVVENGYKYSKEIAFDSYVNVAAIRGSDTPPPDLAEAKEKEAKRILDEINLLLKEGKVKEAYNNFILSVSGIDMCHQYWSRKRAVLRHEYGIDWKSPAEMNPTVIFG